MFFRQKIKIIFILFLITFSNHVNATKSPCIDVFDGKQFELSSSPQKIIYLSEKGSSYQAIISKLENGDVRTEFLDGDRAGKVFESKLSTINNIIAEGRITLSETLAHFSNYPLIVAGPNIAGRPYHVDARVFDLGMIFDNIMLVRNQKVAFPIEGKFTEAKLIGRGAKNNKLVLVEITNNKGEVVKHEIEATQLREIEFRKPIVAALSAKSIATEEKHYSEVVAPGQKVEAHIYRGGSLGQRDVVLNGRVYYYKDEVAAPRSNNTFTRARVIGAKPEANTLIAQFYSVDGNTYSKEIKQDELRYAADYVRKAQPKISLVEPVPIGSAEKNAYAMKHYKDFYEEASGIKISDWQKTEIKVQGSGKVGESLDITQLKEYDQMRAQDPSKGFLWAIDTYGKLKILPRVLAKKGLWFVHVGDDVSKHYNLLDGRGAQAAGELHFDPQTGKAIFDFASGTYMRHITPQEQAIIYERIAPKLKEVAGEGGFSFEAQ